MIFMFHIKANSNPSIYSLLDCCCFNISLKRLDMILNSLLFQSLNQASPDFSIQHWDIPFNQKKKKDYLIKSDNAQFFFFSISKFYSIGNEKMLFINDKNHSKQRYQKKIFVKGSIENIKRVNHLYISHQKYHFGREKQHIFECPQKGSKVIFGSTEIGLTIASLRQVQGQNKKWRTHHTWCEVQGKSDFFQLTQEGIQYDGKIIFKGLIPYKAEEDGITQFQLLPVRVNDQWTHGMEFNGFVEHQQKANSPVLGFKLHLRQDPKYGYIDTAVVPLVGYRSWTTNKKQFYQQKKEDFPQIQK